MLFGKADLGYDIGSGNFTTSTWQEWVSSVVRGDTTNKLIISSLNLNKDSELVAFILTSVNGHAVNYKR